MKQNKKAHHWAIFLNRSLSSLVITSQLQVEWDNIMNSFDFIKTKEKEITSFLQELVRAPSQNGIDPERNIAALI